VYGLNPAEEEPEPSGDTDPAGRREMEWEILQLLLLKADDWPWCAIVDVVAATVDPITALDALAALGEVGLIQRRGRYVTATRAAHKFHQLITWP
jgi:hypothetical protein